MKATRLAGSALRRTRKMVPLARVIVVGQLAVLAGRHIAKLGPAERARLLVLLRKAHGRPSTLGDDEHEELIALVARIEPQAFLGTAVQRLSPVPVPRRLVEGGAKVLGRALGGGR